MKIEDAQHRPDPGVEGPDLFTAHMEHLNKWMPLDGVWQTCYGTETGPRGYEPDRFEALMSSWFGLSAPDGLHPYPYEHLTPAAGPNGRWHVFGVHGRDVLWRRLMVPVVTPLVDKPHSIQ